MSVPLALMVLLLSVLTVTAQNTKSPPLPPFHVPDNVVVRHVDIYSEGTRMSGQFYSDKKFSGTKLANDHHGAWMGWVGGIP